MLWLFCRLHAKTSMAWLYWQFKNLVIDLGYCLNEIEGLTVLMILLVKIMSCKELNII